MKKNLLTFGFAIFSIINVYCVHTLYEFGPKTENVVVLAAIKNYKNEDTASATLLRKFANVLADEELSQTVLIAIIDNDEPDIPKNTNLKNYKNTKDFIQHLHNYNKTVVFIISDGKTEKLKIKTGAFKLTSPHWLIKDLYNILKADNVKVDFNLKNILLYRLGILNDDNFLGEFLASDIPAIAISGNISNLNILKKIIFNYSNEIPQEWDRHFLVYKIFNLNIIPEKLIILLLISIILAGLFYIFMFSFLFRKKNENNIRDLLKIWWLPIIFFIVNIFSLYLCEKIILLIFRMIFDTKEAVNDFPFTVIFFKISFVLFISFIFVKISRKIKLPHNEFICGYLSSIICFINIFIFASSDLSLSILFLEIYIISFLFCNTKNIFFQLFLVCLNFILLLYNFSGIIYETENIVQTLFYANKILTSLFFVPYNMTMTSLIFTFEKKQINFNFFKKFSLFIFLPIYLFAVICLVFYDKILQDTSSESFLVYKFTEEKKNVLLITNSKTAELPLKGGNDITNLNVDDFLTVSSKLENYLERSIGEITVSSNFKIASLNVILTNEYGFPIYEANSEFDTFDFGKSVSFFSPVNITDSFSIKFSSEKNILLNVKIIAWFYDMNDAAHHITGYENLRYKKILFAVEKIFSLKSTGSL